MLAGGNSNPKVRCGVTCVMSEFGRWKPEDPEFRASLDYTVSLKPAWVA